MADCVTCGKKLGFMEGNRGMCPECFGKSMLSEARQREVNRDAEKSQEEAVSAAIDAVMLTTEVATTLNVIERIEVVTAEVAFGMNIFKDLFASARDIVGGRSKAVQKSMRDARRLALFELKKEAFEVGANAVVGVDLDYVEISANANMILLVASGTAVRVA